MDVKLNWKHYIQIIFHIITYTEYYLYLQANKYKGKISSILRKKQL